MSESPRSDSIDRIRRMEACENYRQPSPLQALHKAKVVTIPGNSSADIPIGTLKAILKSAGLEDKR